MVIASAEAVAAIAAAATLLAAAGLTYMTLHTTKLRLTHERERQKAELAAEAGRQADALDHERELADLHDLRNLLDQAAAALDRADGARRAAGVLISFAGDEDIGGDAAEMTARHDQLKAAIPELVTLSARLRVRLGPDDPLTASFTKAQGALDVIRLGLWIMRRSEGGDRAKKVKAKAKEESAAFTDAMEAFFNGAVERAGTAIGNLAPKRDDQPGSDRTMG
jgi:hypothetical protein